MSLIPCSSITFLFALSRIVITGFTNNTPQFDQRTVKIDSYSVLFRRISAKCRLLHFIYIKRYNNINSFLFFFYLFFSFFGFKFAKSPFTHWQATRDLSFQYTRHTKQKFVICGKECIHGASKNKLGKKTNTLLHFATKKSALNATTIEYCPINECMRSGMSVSTSEYEIGCKPHRTGPWAGVRRLIQAEHTVLNNNTKHWTQSQGTRYDPLLLRSIYGMRECILSVCIEHQTHTHTNTHAVTQSQPHTIFSVCVWYAWQHWVEISIFGFVWVRTQMISYNTHIDVEFYIPPKGNRTQSHSIYVWLTHAFAHLQRVRFELHSWRADKIHCSRYAEQISVLSVCSYSLIVWFVFFCA